VLGNSHILEVMWELLYQVANWSVKLPAKFTGILKAIFKVTVGLDKNKCRFFIFWKDNSIASARLKFAIAAENQQKATFYRRICC